ncbi:MAG: DUF3341 domain-containing protein [Acidobacteria bacterium]|nr:DUF3341 domain-containing protein [Acidobacteriota bacterium]
MITIFGLFVHPTDALCAVQRIERLGVEQKNIEVLTAAPYHEIRVTGDAGERTISRYAVAGGIIGTLSGAALAAGTAAIVHLPTGGMPIVSLGPVGIIMFALAGLGAVTGTVFSTVRAAGLARFKPSHDDSGLMLEVAKGGLLLAIECGKDLWVQPIKQILCDAGAYDVK